MRLLDKYSLARCCNPKEGDPIVGYFSFDDHIKVHHRDCRNLTKAEQDRLVVLEWQTILASEPDRPGDDYRQLNTVDFAVLRHHAHFGVDYSLKVARMITAGKQAVFDSHRKLKDLGLLERVDATMIRYRKGIVDNKWIKHRNHTYYRITGKGRMYLAHHDTGEA